MRQYLRYTLSKSENLNKLFLFLRRCFQIFLHLAANVATMSKEEFKEYQQEMKTERDINSIKWTAEMRGRERGLKEGLEKGRQEGRQEQAIQIARNFKSDGIPHEVIAKNTGLSIEQIEKL
mgnify:CR=1 FL=1